MRTKEEMIAILSRRKVSQKLAESTWSDLVASIQSATPVQRNALVSKIATNRAKEAGEMLHKALLKNAEERARIEVEAMLADDNLSLAELDSLL